MLPTLALVKTFSSRTQPVRALSTPSVRKSEAPPATPDNNRMNTPILAIRMSIRPSGCEAKRNHTPEAPVTSAGGRARVAPAGLTAGSP